MTPILTSPCQGCFHDRECHASEEDQKLQLLPCRLCQRTPRPHVAPEDPTEQAQYIRCYEPLESQPDDRPTYQYHALVVYGPTLEEAVRVWNRLMGGTC
jgi:hypothetical protein